MTCCFVKYWIAWLSCSDFCISETDITGGAAGAAFMLVVIPVLVNNDKAASEGR